MTGFADTITESFKQTLNWSMWLYFFLIFLIEGIVLGIIALIFVFIGFVSVFGSLASVGGIENLPALFSNSAFISGSFGTIVFLFLVFIIIATFVEAVFTGMRYHLFNDFLKTDKFNLGKAFQKTKPRVFTYFLISLIIGLIVLAVFAIAFTPILFILPGLISGSVVGSNASLIIAPLFVSVFLMMLLGFLFFLISPMLNLLAPTVFFEEKGVIDTIKKSFNLMKTNYWGNLAYIILVFLIVFAICMLLQVVFLPFTILIGLIKSGFPAAIGLLVLVGIIYFIIILIYTVWMSVFDTASFRNLFFLDKSLFSHNMPKHKPKATHKAKPTRKANPKHKAKKKKAK